jgi:signal transduction histidine kinase
MDVDFDRLEGEAGIEFVVKQDEKLSDLLRPFENGGKSHRREIRQFESSLIGEQGSRLLGRSVDVAQHQLFGGFHGWISLAAGGALTRTLSRNSTRRRGSRTSISMHTTRFTWPAAGARHSISSFSARNSRAKPSAQRSISLRGLPFVRGDRVQLQQVFANLAVNALQAMADHGERRLIIRTAQTEPKTIYAEVEDTGLGIPAGQLHHLFQSFFTTKKGGMGIGLAICRSIVESHGGRLGATNLPGGRGARFHFTLPTLLEPWVTDCFESGHTFRLGLRLTSESPRIASVAIARLALQETVIVSFRIGASFKGRWGSGSNNPQARSRYGRQREKPMTVNGS